MDVTDIDDDEEVFDKMRVHYKTLRGKLFRNPFMKPTTMQYVEVSLSSPSRTHYQDSLTNKSSSI